MFETYNAAQYRALDVEALEERRAAIVAELENPESTIETDVLDAQARLCEAEFERRNSAAQLRSLQMKAVASGAGKIIDKAGDREDSEMQERKAFYEYCRSGRITEGLQLRLDATSVTADNAAVIPTTILREIQRKMGEYGELFSLVRKTNIQGGVSVPTIDTIPTASWVTEAAVSYTQALETASISFNYYMVECRIAQSLRRSVVSNKEFEALFVELAVEAITHAIEDAIVNGDGSGKPLGILNSTLVPDDNKIDMAATDMTWEGWHTAISVLGKAYRNGIFVMSQGTWDSKIAGMTDDNGQPVARVNYGINGDETYRFMGRRVVTVESDILPNYADADEEDAFAIYFKPSDYLLNSNLQMQVVRWEDHDNNKRKVKAQMVVDGKLINGNGVLIFSIPEGD